jgi:hypothetical protein
VLAQLPSRISEAGSRASTPRAAVAVPREGLSQVAILLMTVGAGLVLLLARGLVGAAARPAPPAGDLTAPPIPTPMGTGPLIEVGTLDLRRPRDNRVANGALRLDVRRKGPEEERSAGDR